MEIPKKINGGIFSNNLGTIKFVNDFDLKSYKRFYNITLPRKNIIRAFHGHLKEGKAVFVTSGSLLLCSVKIDHKVKPNKKNKVKKYLLSASKPKIIIIPKGFANGIMSLEKNTNVIFFSNKSLTESEKDDYRFPENYWGKDVWE